MSEVVSYDPFDSDQIGIAFRGVSQTKIEREDVQCLISPMKLWNTTAAGLIKSTARFQKLSQLSPRRWPLRKWPPKSRKYPAILKPSNLKMTRESGTQKQPAAEIARTSLSKINFNLRSIRLADVCFQG